MPINNVTANRPHHKGENYTAGFSAGCQVILRSDSWFNGHILAVNTTLYRSPCPSYLPWRTPGCHPPPPPPTLLQSRSIALIFYIVNPSTFVIGIKSSELNYYRKRFKQLKEICPGHVSHLLVLSSADKNGLLDNAATNILLAFLPNGTIFLNSFRLFEFTFGVDASNLCQTGQNKLTMSDLRNFSF